MTEALANDDLEYCFAVHESFRITEIMDLDCVILRSDVPENIFSSREGWCMWLRLGIYLAHHCINASAESNNRAKAPTVIDENII